MFRYLQAGLCIVLIYVGARMLISDFADVPIGVSLGVIATVLASSIVASLLFPPAVKPGGDGVYSPSSARADRGEDQAA